MTEMLRKMNRPIRHREYTRTVLLWIAVVVMICSAMVCAQRPAVTSGNGVSATDSSYLGDTYLTNPYVDAAPPAPQIPAGSVQEMGLPHLSATPKASSAGAAARSLSPIPDETISEPAQRGFSGYSISNYKAGFSLAPAAPDSQQFGNMDSLDDEIPARRPRYTRGAASVVKPRRLSVDTLREYYRTGEYQSARTGLRPPTPTPLSELPTPEANFFDSAKKADAAANLQMEKLKQLHGLSDAGQDEKAQPDAESGKPSVVDQGFETMSDAMPGKRPLPRPMMANPITLNTVTSRLPSASVAGRHKRDRVGAIVAPTPEITEEARTTITQYLMLRDNAIDRMPVQTNPFSTPAIPDSLNNPYDYPGYDRFPNVPDWRRNPTLPDPSRMPDIPYMQSAPGVHERR